MYTKAEAQAIWCQIQSGKMDAAFYHKLDEEWPVRQVIRMTARHSNKEGQLLLEPEINVEGWLIPLSPSVADDLALIQL